MMVSTESRRVKARGRADEGSFSIQKLTIALDLGDQWSWCCVLDEAGQLQLNQEVGTTLKAMKEVPPAVCAIVISVLSLAATAALACAKALPAPPHYASICRNRKGKRSEKLAATHPVPNAITFPLNVRPAPSQPP
jgi:hypothetical protein